jgi:hypothetical protein
MGTTSPLSAVAASKDSKASQDAVAEPKSDHDAKVAAMHHEFELLKLERAMQSEFAPCRSIALQGEEDAHGRHLTGGWKTAGFWGGMLGLAPGYIICAFASGSDPQAPAHLVPEDPELAKCYRAGYTDSARRMNAKAALGGCGFAAFLLVVGFVTLAACGGNGDD